MGTALSRSIDNSMKQGKQYIYKVILQSEIGNRTRPVTTGLARDANEILTRKAVLPASGYDFGGPRIRNIIPDGR